ncbi:MAG: glycosyltransferase [Nitrospirae bacterium]|nr:glycosyltransferase [Nitrospirota bacterium]
MSPTVSVLMSVYNGERYLYASIDSILKQRFSDFEFIIIDDCCTDNSAKIIKTFNDKRIVYVKNDVNLGLTLSLNKGLNQCRGKYIARIDADDISVPHRLKMQVQFLDQSDYIMIGSWVYIINEDNKVVSKKKLLTKCMDIRYKLLFRNSFIHSTVMYRRDVVLKLNGYDPNYLSTEDYELWSRLSRIGNIGNIPKYLVYWREHSQNISSTTSSVQVDYTKRISYENQKVIMKDRQLSTALSEDDFSLSIRLVDDFFEYFKYPDEIKQKFIDDVYLSYCERNVFLKDYSVLDVLDKRLLINWKNLLIIFRIIVKKTVGRHISDLIRRILIIKNRA